MSAERRHPVYTVASGVWFCLRCRSWNEHAEDVVLTELERHRLAVLRGYWQARWDR